MNTWVTAKSINAPLIRSERVRSQDWDEVAEFCRSTYMPYHVEPLEKDTVPSATMFSRNTGRVKASRFAYGTGVHLNDFDPEAGNILVLTTLNGAGSHHFQSDPATTQAGESFVVDCARTDYWLNADPEHLQFNFTIPHALMEETARKWFGYVPGNALWTQRVKFGGRGSRWLAMLEYVARSIGGEHPIDPNGPMGRHLEELICLNLLQEWAAEAGVSLETGARAAAPHYVRRAEEMMTSEARIAPSIGDIAQRVGVSARTLSEGFRRFRGVTPREFLADRRLDGLRADLLAAESNRTVTEIAGSWGFVNIGALARSYRARFGETPSQTLARS